MPRTAYLTDVCLFIQKKYVQILNRSSRFLKYYFVIDGPSSDFPVLDFIDLVEEGTRISFNNVQFASFAETRRTKFTHSYAFGRLVT